MLGTTPSPTDLDRPDPSLTTHYSQLEDIEDMSVDLEDSQTSRVSSRSITIRSFARGVNKENKIDEENGDDDGKNEQLEQELVDDGVGIDNSTTTDNNNNNNVKDTDHFLPGTQTIYVRTWGCSHNNSDSEYMAGLLASEGYKVVLEDAKKESADLWLLNSCTVKNPSEQTFVNEIQKAQGNGKKVVLAGCVPQASQKDAKWNGLSTIGVQQIDRVVEVVEETLKGHTVRLFSEKKESKRKLGGADLSLPKIRKNPLIEIIPINTGCLNQCTYCKTKQARGDLGSYHPIEIVNRIRQVLPEGVVEIWLTSEDTGAYGRDIGVSIVDLLKQIVQVLDEWTSGPIMLRIGMTNPPYILEHLEEIAKILNHPKVYKFLHVPVQAASDQVLHDMRRKYTQNDFRFVVDYLRQHVPGMTIATDIICGFPTETAADFDQTLDLVKEYEFPVLHISQFYPRPGTPAAKLTRIPTEEVKRRSRECTSLFESYRCYDSAMGERYSVLVTENSTDSRYFVGHDDYYRQVLVPKIQGLMGKMVDVEIIETGKYYLMGKLVDEEGVLASLGKSSDDIATETEPVDSEKPSRALPKYIRKNRELVRVEPEGPEDYTPSTTVTKDSEENTTIQLQSKRLNLRVFTIKSLTYVLPTLFSLYVLLFEELMSFSGVSIKYMWRLVLASVVVYVTMEKLRMVYEDSLEEVVDGEKKDN